MREGRGGQVKKKLWYSGKAMGLTNSLIALLVYPHTKNKGRNAYKGFLPFFEKPGAIKLQPHTTDC